MSIIQSNFIIKHKVDWIKTVFLFCCPQHHHCCLIAAVHLVFSELKWADSQVGQEPYFRKEQVCFCSSPKLQGFSFSFFFLQCFLRKHFSAHTLPKRASWENTFEALKIFRLGIQFRFHQHPWFSSASDNTILYSWLSQYSVYTFTVILGKGHALTLEKTHHFTNYYAHRIDLCL